MTRTTPPHPTHDFTWDHLPQHWSDAPFFGNGTLGAMLLQHDDHTLRLELGRGDVQDYRPPEELDVIFGRCRLPVGHFLIHYPHPITANHWRLSLQNARLQGTVATADAHTHTLDLLVAATQPIIRFHTQGQPDITFVPGNPTPPRQAFHTQRNSPPRFLVPDDYEPNPPGTLDTSNPDTPLWHQPLLRGGDTAVAWQHTDDTLYTTVQHNPPNTDANTLEQARDATAHATTHDADLLAQHADWWNAYYPISSVELPDDPDWEAFYWRQVYKLGSASRAGGPIMDNQGPWLQETPWPMLWWNLNVQLAHWPLYTAGRFEQAAPLPQRLEQFQHHLIHNVAPQYQHDSAGLNRESCQQLRSNPVAQPAPHTDTTPNGKPIEIGNLLWTLHNLWLHAIHADDDDLHQRLLFPLLRRAVNYHLHFLTEHHGKLRLPPTHSPEFINEAVEDCTYDLALLRWGCRQLLNSAQHLHLKDPLAPRWQDVLDRLIDYPTDEGGYRVGSNQPFNKGHRHYSHLLQAYPLYDIHRDQPDAWPIVKQSLNRWLSFESGKQGYTWTGAASLYAAFGHGNDALDMLNGLKPFLQPNTLYREAGPVIETPLSAMQCIHDLLIQHHNGAAELLPALPDAWTNLRFTNLRLHHNIHASLTLAQGQLQHAQLTTHRPQTLRLRLNAHVRPEHLPPDTLIENQTATLQLQPHQPLELQP
ncbi:MAG: glycoside hydrolase family 95-like protein [Planctomycetota bacterium]